MRLRKTLLRHHDEQTSTATATRCKKAQSTSARSSAADDRQEDVSGTKSSGKRRRTLANRIQQVLLCLKEAIIMISACLFRCCLPVVLCLVATTTPALARSPILPHISIGVSAGDGSTSNGPLQGLEPLLIWTAEKELGDISFDVRTQMNQQNVLAKVSQRCYFSSVSFWFAHSENCNRVDSLSRLKT